MMYIYNELKGSKYWLSEINKSQDALSYLNTGEDSGVQKVENDNNKISMQTSKFTRENIMKYIEYCENEYEKAYCYEKKPECSVIKNNSITFFSRSETGL